MKPAFQNRTATSVLKVLVPKACIQSRRFAKGKTIREAYEQCPSASWLNCLVRAPDVIMGDICERAERMRSAAHENAWRVAYEPLAAIAFRAKFPWSEVKPQIEGRFNRAAARRRRTAQRNRAGAA